MTYQLTDQDIADLEAKDYSDSDIAQAVKELNSEEELTEGYNKAKEGMATDPRANASHSAFGSKVSDDIARWQLELNDILEKAEHVLRGDIVVFENGQLIWKDNPKPQQNTLNKEGVQLCMKLLSIYVNRNTILADYTDEEIRFKVLDFGKRFNDLIFLKYDEMGMDNEEKRKEYASLVGAMTDIVHSAYARAKDGRERESYRKMISVSQASSGLQGGGAVTVNAGSQQPKTRGILNPMRYIAGKYV
jgi:hypothetical protein